MALEFVFLSEKKSITGDYKKPGFQTVGTKIPSLCLFKVFNQYTQQKNAQEKYEAKVLSDGAKLYK